MGISAGGAAALAATAVSTGVSMYASSQQAGAQADAQRYQAQVARNNEIVANQNAKLAQQQADARAQAAYRVGAQRLGAQRVAMAANGVTLDSGSPLDVQAATAGATEQDVQNARYQGALQDYGFRAQGANYGAQAGLSDYAADRAEGGAGLAVAGTFLSGASQFASKWDAYKRTGMIGRGPALGGEEVKMGGLY